MSQKIQKESEESALSYFLKPPNAAESCCPDLLNEAKLLDSSLFLWLNRDETVFFDDSMISKRSFALKSSSIKRFQQSMEYRPSLPRYLKLIRAPWSADCEKVLFALYEKELDFQCITFDPSVGNNLVPVFLRANPKAHNPVLLTDRSTIADTMDIIHYLEQTFSQGDFNSLIPSESSEEKKTYDEMIEVLDSISLPVVTYGAIFNTDLTKDWKLTEYEYTFYKENIKRWQAILDEFIQIYPRDQNYYESKGRELHSLLETTSDKEQVFQYFTNIANVLKEIEIKFLMRQGQIKWLCGSCFTFADISLAVLLHRLEFLGLCYWYCYCSNIACYYEEIKKMESFQKTFEK